MRLTRLEMPVSQSTACPQRIAVLYRTTEGPWGGGNSFLRSLKRVWQAQGIDVVDSLQAGLDGVLVNSSFLGAARFGRMLTPALAARLVKTGHASIWTARLGLSRWRKAGVRPPFVHRLDGVFRLYGRPANDPADIAQVGINRHMDWTIYQSEFCRQSFAAEGLDVSRSTVIYNAVDLERFFPAEQIPHTRPFKLIAMSWSPNIRKGAPYAVQASQLPGIEVTFVGNWPKGLSPGNVQIIPPQAHDNIPGLLRQHHVLLHMAQNDPCSNVILEGMACGLPVVYHPSGGSPQIVGACGLPGEPNLGAAIQEIQDRYVELRARVLERRPQLSVMHAARAYLRVFEELGPIRV